MSFVRPEELSLPRLLSLTDTVFVARRASPPSQERFRPVDGLGPDGKKVPPFEYTEYAFDVLEPLWPRGGDPVPKAVSVPQPHVDQDFLVYEMSVLEGRNKSPIHEVYASPVLPADQGPFLLFLSRDGREGFSFPAEGALERLDKKSEVLRMLEELNSPETRLVRVLHSGKPGGGGEESSFSVSGDVSVKPISPRSGEMKEFRLPPSSVRNVLVRMEELDFWRWESAKDLSVADGGTRRISLTVPGNEKTVYLTNTSAVRFDEIWNGLGDILSRGGK